MSLPPPVRGDGGWWEPDPATRTWQWVPDGQPPPAARRDAAPVPKRKRRRRWPWYIAGGFAGIVALGFVVEPEEDPTTEVASEEPSKLDRLRAEAEERKREQAAEQAERERKRAAEEGARRATGRDVIRACQGWAKERLKAPATAEFPDGATASEGPPDTWAVRGEVDSENSFGALIRSGYRCTVVYHHDSKTVTTNDVEIIER